MMQSRPKLGVLITGVSGFVGGAVARRMCQDPDMPFSLRGAVRRPLSDCPSELLQVAVKGLEADTDWQEAVKGVDIVIHAAARVHIMAENVEVSLAEFRRINVDGTLNLARQAAKAGVRRFVFVSSVKVNGEATERGYPFCADDFPSPKDAYGISKQEAEEGLRALTKSNGIDLVIIRPPLVYGPGVKANFLSMMRWLLLGIPLPLGDIDNNRSLVARDNLVDLILTCISHPAAANQTFLVSDGEDISTTQLLRRLGDALGKPARLLPVPVWMLEAGAALLGKRNLSQRLCGDLQVDISKTRDLLGWSPPMSVNEGLRVTAESFLAGWSE